MPCEPFPISSFPFENFATVNSSVYDSHILIIFLFSSGLKTISPTFKLSIEIERVWGKRGDRYSELRSENTVALPKVEMSHIGG